MTRNFKPTAPGRPKSFDDRLVEYMPGLHSLASKLGFKGEDRADLVSDTMITALHRWGSYREGGGFWSWLSLTMRACARDRRNASSRELTLISDADGKYALRVAVEANQEKQAELSDVLRRTGARDGQILIQRALGDGVEEIAAELGISRERVRQLEERARAQIVEAA